MPKAWLRKGLWPTIFCQRPPRSHTIGRDLWQEAPSKPYYWQESLARGPCATMLAARILAQNTASQGARGSEQDGVRQLCFVFFASLCSQDLSPHKASNVAFWCFWRCFFPTCCPLTSQRKVTVFAFPNFKSGGGS